MAWNTRGLETPPSDEFLNNPDFRQIAAFFLGWVFFYSVHIIFSSPLLQENFIHVCASSRLLFTKPAKGQHESGDIEARTHTDSANEPRHEEKVPKYNTAFDDSSTASRPRIQAGNALLVILALCFTCASVAHFASLLQYTIVGETACAFVVAWGGTAAQAGRLTGLLILSLELRKLAVIRREIYTLWTLLAVLLGLVFANNAIAVGILRPVPPLRISLCYRKHFAPTGLASSLALISAELYLATRFIFFTSPKGLGWFSRLDLLGDSRVYRTLSLLLLDVLTITSAAKSTNLLVDFVPFAIGGVVVLFAFNSGPPKKKKEAAPSLWSYYNETRRFALYPTPAPSMASTLSIRRFSGHTTRTSSSCSPGYPERDPPPASTRSALNLRVALRDFTTREQQNSRAVIDGRTRARTESLTLTSLATPQSPRSARSSIRRFLSMRPGNSGIQSIRESLPNGGRAQMALVIGSDEQILDVPRLPESSIALGLGFHPADFLRMPPPRKHSNRIRRSSTSSGWTYMTPVSQKAIPSRGPSRLLSPSRSHQRSMVSMPQTPIPTWGDAHRQRGSQFDDPRPEIPLVPSLADSFNRQFASHAPVVPSVPFVARSPTSPPPGLAMFRPMTHASSLANTPPLQRISGIRGPRPLVTRSKPRNRT